MRAVATQAVIGGSVNVGRAFLPGSEVIMAPKTKRSVIGLHQRRVVAAVHFVALAALSIDNR